MGFRPDVIERQLAHEERNAIRAAYNRAEYLRERRVMMKRGRSIAGKVAVMALLERHDNTPSQVRLHVLHSLRRPEVQGIVRDNVKAGANVHTDAFPSYTGLIADYAHNGALRAPLIDLASEFDHLVPPSMHFVPYGQLVAAAGKSNLYRSELMPGTQHVDRWSDDPDFPTLHPGYPRVLAAFDELVKWVEG